MVKLSENLQKIKPLPIEVVIYALEVMASEIFPDGEPMYDLNDRNIGILKTLLEAPFASFDGIEKYQSISEKAAALYCSAIEGHKFGNGNKRTGVILLLMFLAYNDWWITISAEDLYELSIHVADDKKRSFDQKVEQIANVFEQLLVKP